MQKFIKSERNKGYFIDFQLNNCLLPLQKTSHFGCRY